MLSFVIVISGCYNIQANFMGFLLSGVSYAWQYYKPCGLLPSTRKSKVIAFI